MWDLIIYFLKFLKNSQLKLFTFYVCIEICVKSKWDKKRG